MKKILFLSVAILVGCAAKMTDKAASIQVHSQMSTLLADCKKIGPVSASVKSSMMDYDALAMQAKIRARERSADMGADTLVITNIDVLDGSSTATAQGVAMRCN